MIPATLTDREINNAKQVPNQISDLIFRISDLKKLSIELIVNHKSMLKIDPATTPFRDFYQYLIGAVAPRPIAFISTMGADGAPNLAPYSFFNAFSGKPPIVAFSAARRRGDHPEKDTLTNILHSGELVINSVSFDISRQMALTSIEFPPGTDEFVKAGFTKVPSEMVAPFRVGESKIQLECKVDRVVPIYEDDQGASLVICRVLLLHLHPDILTENGRIDPHKADLMGRMGRQYYVRSSGDAVVEIAQDTKSPAIGFDGLPKSIRESRILTGNQLAQLAALTAWPEATAPEELSETETEALHRTIAALIDRGEAAVAAELVAGGS